jgi:hypothetical protein
MLEKRLVLSGFAAGAIAGLLAFVFARIFAEPVIQTAIDYESGRDAAKESLRKAAGLSPEPPGMEIFSRGIQRSIGIGSGLVLFGVAMGGLVAVAFIVCHRRYGDRFSPRTLAALVAGGGFLTIYLIPFLKYPSNPPAIGHADTIRDRSFLYVTMLLVSLTTVLAVLWLAGRLRARFGGWNAALISIAGGVVFLAVVMHLLPSVGELHTNVVEYGRHTTETPQPLKDAKCVIVYPGFPADTLFKFRFYTIINQFILWAAIGLAFGPLAERALAPISENDSEFAAVPA